MEKFNNYFFKFLGVWYILTAILILFFDYQMPDYNIVIVLLLTSVFCFIQSDNKIDK